MLTLPSPSLLYIVSVVYCSLHTRSYTRSRCFSRHGRDWLKQGDIIYKLRYQEFVTGVDEADKISRAHAFFEDCDPNDEACDLEHTKNAFQPVSLFTSLHGQLD